MAKTFSGPLMLILLVLTTGCAAPPQHAEDREIAALAAQIRSLSETVDPTEAARAARIAFAHSYQLSRDYQITDPPLIHNTKVNMGLRPRGLCWHWAEDMEKRLAQEGFETLALHRAIANSENPLRIEHSTTIISARGDGMYDGIVLDPWRKGGRLTWIATRKDTDYKWRPQRQVLLAKQQRRARRAN